MGHMKINEIILNEGFGRMVQPEDMEENLDLDFNDDDETVLTDIERLKNQAGIKSAIKHASDKLIGNLK
jgi:hypothetical protein